MRTGDTLWLFGLIAAILAGPPMQYLLGRRWFWDIALFAAGLLAALGMMAALIHFQNVEAAKLFLVWAIVWAILALKSYRRAFASEHAGLSEG